MPPIYALARRDRRLTWTKSQIQQMEQRWQTGASASRIARELGGGISRDAVLSKIRRLRLAERRVCGEAGEFDPSLLARSLHTVGIVEHRDAVEVAGFAQELPAPMNHRLDIRR